MTASQDEVHAADEVEAHNLGPDSAPSPRARVGWVEVDGEIVILDEATGATHLLNPTAALVWKCLDGVSTIDEIAVDIASAYDQDIEAVLAPVLAAVQTFGQHGLLVGVRPFQPQPSAKADAIPVGQAVPDFELEDMSGNVCTLADFAGRLTLMVNWSPRCGYCDKIAPDIAGAQTALRDNGVQLVFLTSGEADANQEVLDRFDLSPTVLLRDSGNVEMFAGMGTPAAYLLDGQGIVLNPLALGAVQVPVLVMSALAPASDA
jgi:thiol-disulfide isomerase/thioredoxin